jgi:hypothetical protein
MLCPTCHRDGYEMPKPAAPILDEAYQAQRRIDAAETVAFFRRHADEHDRAGRSIPAAIWRREAALLEANCARIWGDVLPSAESK